MKNQIINFFLVAGVLSIFAGCSFGGSSEKQDVIDATVKVACMLYETGANFADYEDQSLEVIKDYGFETQEEFDAARKKYSDDLEVSQAIQDGVMKCSNGEFSSYLDNTLDPQGAQQ